MKTSDVQTMIRLMQTPFEGAYDDSGEKTKNQFHRLAKMYLRDLASTLGLAPGSYDIRTNKAGPAVLGETTLHGENVYVQFGQCMLDTAFMWRKCNGRKDYSGGANQWTDSNKLIDLGDITRMMREYLDR